MCHSSICSRRGLPHSSNGARFLVCSHYDTKSFDDIRFVGANDGGSSTGALLELARVLSLHPQLAAKIELVFFDGEEAYDRFTDTDGLYGSRYFAEQLNASHRQADYRGGILWDMMGDRDLTITLPSIPRPSWLVASSPPRMRCKSATISLTTAVTCWTTTRR